MRVRVTIDVEYDEATLKGVDILSHLERVLEYHIGGGLLTGDSPAVVDEYRLTVGAD